MDFITDQSGRHLVRLNSLLDVPDYVKESSLSDEAIAALPNSIFGTSHRREFPLDTPGHVYLSYGFCKSAGIRTSELMEKILKAASFFAIEADLTKIDDAFNNLVKKASEEKPYALHIDFGPAQPDAENPGMKAGGVQGFYPISTPYEIEQSAVKLANERSRIPLELFCEACRNIVKAAKVAQVPSGALPRSVNLYGVERMPQPDFLEKMAAERKAITGDEIYTDIATAALEGGDDKSSHAFAELWLQADRLNGYKAASKNEPDPFMIFNSGRTVEEAERQLESWTVLNGAAVPVEKIAALKEADVTKWYAKPIAEKIVGIAKRAAERIKGSELAVAIGELEAGIQASLHRRLAN
jgi:hypothetical protein